MRAGITTSWATYVRAVVGKDRQVDIAAKTGVDQGTVSRWLHRGENITRPAAEAVRAFAAAYNRPALEAFVAAGFLEPDEADLERLSRRIELRDISDLELLDELRRRQVERA